MTSVARPVGVLTASIARPVGVLMAALPETPVAGLGVWCDWKYRRVLRLYAQRVLVGVVG